MAQGDTQAETDKAPTENPIWNEAIIFKITDENQPLRLSLMNERG